MPGWQGSTRARRLPRNWKTISARILARDGHTCRRCGAVATEVDHVRPGDDHSDGNLQALCHSCHQAKTLNERPQRGTNRRPREKHPGLLVRARKR